MVSRWYTVVECRPTGNVEVARHATYPDALLDACTRQMECTTGAEFAVEAPDGVVYPTGTR